MSRPLLLDLCCGAGGASLGYYLAGFEPVGVDIEPQNSYPFEFHQADVLDFDFGDRPFVAVHASPPCQAYSPLRHRKKDHDYPRLVEPIRERCREWGLPYVIENVVEAPLVDPVVLCGSMFGLGVRRHRGFETSFPVLTPPCAHNALPAIYDVYEHGHWYKSRFAKVYGNGTGKANDEWQRAMGIDWMKNSEIVEAIPPAYTQFLGGWLFQHIGLHA